jgi:hypothetical protein
MLDKAMAIYGKFSAVNLSNDKNPFDVKTPEARQAQQK